MEKSTLYQVIINSMSAHVAVLDEQGVILETNQTWQSFARDNGMLKPHDCVGINYLSICETPECEDPDSDERRVADGIRRVLKGDLPEFFSHYPCHSPTEKRWFAVRAVPFRDNGKIQAIVTQENITPIIETQEVLKETEVELRNERERLEETNIALRVLLRQRGRDGSPKSSTPWSRLSMPTSGISSRPFCRTYRR